MDYYGNNDYRDYIAHHGRLGQKWGERNGPPYPLDRTQFSGLEKKFAGKSRSSAKVTYEKTDSSSLKMMKSKPKPNREVTMTNPYKGKYNCMLCTTAFEMRRRGYDVVAKGDSTLEAFGRKQGLPAKAIKKWFPDSKLDGINARSREDEKYMQQMAASKNGNTAFAKDVIRTFKKEQGPGARGNLMLRLTPNSGHSVAYEVTWRGILLYDGQRGATYSESQTKQLLARTIGIDFVRLDDVDFNEQEIKKVIQNRR